MPEPVRNLGAEGRIREMGVSVRKRTVMLVFIMTVMPSISVSVSSRTQSDTHATVHNGRTVLFLLFFIFKNNKHFVWYEWWVAVRLGLFASVSGQLELGGRYGVGRSWSSGARFLFRFNVIFPLRTDMILLSSSYVFLLWHRIAQ